LGGGGHMWVTLLPTHRVTDLCALTLWLPWGPLETKPARNPALSSSRYAGPVGGHLHKWVTLLTTHRVTNLCTPHTPVTLSTG